MRIDFELKYKNEKEKDIREDFCKMIVSSIKQEITNTFNLEELSAVFDKVCKEFGIHNKINIYTLMQYISRCIKYKHIKEDWFEIYIDTSLVYPRSKIKLERIIRFIDKGNGTTVKGTGMFKRIFMRYAEEMQKHWKSFKANRLSEFDSKNYFIIT